MKKRAQTLIECPLEPDARARDGHINTWARAAKDAVGVYLDTIARDPEARIVLRLELDA